MVDGRTPYFAYGSNLCLAQMNRRCPGFHVIGRARLDDHQLTFPRRAEDWAGGGVAGIEPASGDHVEGAVYELTNEHIATLDRYEGIVEGCYTRRSVTVNLANGRPLTAITYFANPEPGGPFAPSPGYLGTLMEGARDHDLPDDWVNHLWAVERAARPRARARKP